MSIPAMAVVFFVPGPCVAQPRHSVGRYGAYIPKDHAVHGYKDTVNLVARRAMAGRPPFEGAVEAALAFVLGEPDGPEAWAWDIAKPDLDNLEKAAFDACKGVVYLDDAQIVGTEVAKLRVAGRGRAGLYVVFRKAAAPEAWLPFVNQFHVV